MDIYVPTLKEVINNLRKFSLQTNLFFEVPIGEPAIVHLRCNEDGYAMHATGDRDDICHGEGCEAWDELHIGDTEAELRACAHRLLTTVRDAQLFGNLCLTGRMNCGKLLA